MDLLLLSISIISLFCLLLAFNFLHQPHHKNHPPSPSFSLPLIGHLHLLKHPVHRTLQNLSQKHGPVLSLRFGSCLAVVVSSSSLVQECFTKNDVVLANRPLLKSAKHLTYNYTNLAISPYGEHWRNLRRISTLEILSLSRLNLFMGVREDEVKRLLCKLWDGYSFEEFKVVDQMLPMFMDLMFNIVMRMMCGKKYCGDDLKDEERSKKFKEMVKQVLAISGAGNPGDFIPLWNWIDPTRYEKRVKKLTKTSDELIQQLIDEIRNQNDGENTMIQHLLGLQNTQPENYSDQIIKGLIQVCFSFSNIEQIYYFLYQFLQYMIVFLVVSS